MTNQLLKSVKLSGYKTIKDFNIELEPGLNILIGKNSAGKSNFLNFLYKIMSLNLNDITNFNCNLKFYDDSTLNIEKIFNINKNIDEKSFITSQKLEFNLNDISTDSSTKFIELVNEKDKGYQVIKICHGLPKSQLFIADDVYLKLGKKIIEAEVFKMLHDDNITNFTKYVLLTLLRKGFSKKFESETNNHIIKKNLIEHFENLLFDLNFNINNISSIQRVKVNDGFDVSVDDEYITIKNLKLEYCVDDEWLDFEHLSDGTKRIFYIVSEVLNSSEPTPLIKTPFGFKDIDAINWKTIVLIEEPEIGLHPKQFNLLLQFLKDEAEIKQIIFTTHSPLSLNILNFNELNKISVFKKINGFTTASKISEEEKNKIYDFKEESGLFLSDYWLFANTDF